MAINLSKGGSISLAKEAPGITNATIGLGWKPRQTDGEKFDLDASAFLLGADGKVASDADFIFYKQLSGAGGAVVHQGDNQTGEGEGDDEKIKIDLAKLPESIARIVFAVTIHDAVARKQNFGMVDNAFIRVVNDAGNVEVAKFDLSEDASTETAMNFGELYRHDGGWKFKAVGQGYEGGLAKLASSYGVNIG